MLWRKASIWPTADGLQHSISAARCALGLFGVDGASLSYPWGEGLRSFFWGRPLIGEGGGDLALLLRNEGNFWYRVPCCCFLVGSGWSLVFLDGLWMVAVISWWAVDGYCYFLVGSGWSLVFPGGLWMVTGTSGWAVDGYCYFLVGSGWSLVFPDGLWMLAVISWWALNGYCYFPVHTFWHMAFSKIKGNIWSEGGLPNLSTSNFSPSKIFPSQ